MATYPNTVIDTVYLDDSSILTLGLVLSEAIGLSSILTIDEIILLIEKVGYQEVLDTLITAYISLSDGVGLDEAIKFLWSAVLTDGLGLDETALYTNNKLLQIIDGMVYNDIVDTRITAVNLLVSLIGLNDLLLQGIGELLTDGVAYDDTLIDFLKGYEKLLEDINLSDSIGVFLVLPETLTEGLRLLDAATFGEIISVLVQEGLILTTTFMIPGGTYKGWIMNSENFAVSNYTNYDFKSFAKISGKYYGVQDDGLYLLEGDMDDGEFIKGIIRTGKMDLETSNLKNINKAYIGFRGDGTVIMKVVADEAYETWFEVSPSRTDLHTEQFKLSKGINARYWQFEIITEDSTKLELDTIELFPIILKRKI